MTWKLSRSSPACDELKSTPRSVVRTRCGREHKSTNGLRGVIQILVLLLLVIFVCCRIGISSNDMNPVVLYFLEYLCEKLSNTIRYFSLLARVGDGTHNTVVWRLDLVTSCFFLVSWIHLAVGTKLSSMMLKSLPSMANATVPMSEKRISAVRSRESEIAPSNFLQNLIFKKRYIRKLIVFFNWFPKKTNITCGISSCMDWQVVTSARVASHQVVIQKKLCCICW